MRQIFVSLNIMLLLLLASVSGNAQCNWTPVLSDGFEYSTACPDIIPGTTIHTIPQAYAVHSGSKSLYLNFVNCTTGVGTCPGDTVYVRTFEVCKNMPLRFTTYLTTSFSGLQCNVRIVIVDGNNVVLNDQPGIQPPYAPSWSQYNSGSVTPTTTSVKFIMITNVGGANGNDLSMDDFFLEKCYPTSTMTYTPKNICSNVTQYNLFNLLPGTNNDTTGLWTGTSVLGGGYLGTFTTGVSQIGNYTYTSNYYGTGAGCPAISATLALTLRTAPEIHLGNDTLICSTQSIQLSVPYTVGWTYLWNTGAATSAIVASTGVLAGDTTEYSVSVTDANGCKDTDSQTVTFVLCTGLSDDMPLSSVKVFPNPACDVLHVEVPLSQALRLSLGDLAGRELLNCSFIKEVSLDIKTLSPGTYLYTISNDKGLQLKGKFVKR
jgi:hypothetical protein